MGALRLCGWFVVSIFAPGVLGLVSGSFAALAFSWYLIGIVTFAPVFVISILALLILMQYRREAGEAAAKDGQS